MPRVDPSLVADLIARAQQEVDRGLLPACQLAIGHDGEVVETATLGDAGGKRRFPIMSCTKALVAAATWLLIGDGRMRVDQPVVEEIPEFGTNGKHIVTVEHLLTHTGGFPHAPLPPAAFLDRDARVAAFAGWRLTSEPGTKVEYHATSAFWVLAELITRATGDDHRTFVNRMLDRLGLHELRLGVPAEDQGDIADLVLVPAADGGEKLQANGIDLGEVGAETVIRFNDPVARAAGVPGAGAVGTAADLARFYQALLHNPGGMWDVDVLADATARIRTGGTRDELTGLPANRSLGLVIAGDDGLAFARASMGKTVSPRAFGHEGVGGQIAWADPATGVSFAFLTNGIDADLIRGHRRGVSLSSRAAVCVSDAPSNLGS